MTEKAECEDEKHEGEEKKIQVRSTDGDGERLAGASGFKPGLARGRGPGNPPIKSIKVLEK